MKKSIGCEYHKISYLVSQELVRGVDVREKLEIFLFSDNLTL